MNEIDRLVHAAKAASNSAHYIVGLVEADCKAGDSPNPNERSMPHAALAHCYASVAFVKELDEALKPFIK